MIVYRYLSMEEIIDYVNGRFDKIGQVFGGTEKPNTHRYKDGERYVHFFKNIRDLQIIQKLKGHQGEMLIAKFDIPFTTLAKHMGVGYYPASGYDTDYETVREFAIPTSKLKESFFISCAKDKSDFMTPDEALQSLLSFESRLRQYRQEKRERGEE